MIVFTLLFYTSFLIYAAFGVYVLMINKRSRVNQSFFALCLSLGVWAFGFAMMNCASKIEVVFSWLLVSAVGWCFFPSLFMNFILYLINSPVKLYTRILLLLPGFAFLLHNTAIPAENLKKTGYGWIYLYQRTSLWEILYSMYYVVFLAVIFMLMLNWRRHAPSFREKKQGEIIIVSTAIVALSGLFSDIILPFFCNQVIYVAVLICTIAIGGVGYAVSKYKMMRATLQIESAYILKTMTDPVIYCTPDLVIREVNDALPNTLGYTLHELLGQPISFLFRRDIPMSGSALHNELRNLEVSIYAKDDREIFCLLSGTRVYDDRGESLGYVGVLHDITEKKKIIRELESRVRERTEKLAMINQKLRTEILEKKDMHKALLEAEQKEKQMLMETIELKDNFTTLITHEFKTPIAIINAAIQTLEAVCGNELSAKARKYLHIIRQNSFRQQRLVENLLDITRVKAGMVSINAENTEIISLTVEIIESVKVFAHRKEVLLNFTAELEEEWIRIDREKYERILLNLLSNAIKFTSPKKEIRVSISTEDSYLKLEVSDQGIGISPEKQSAVFEKFERVNHTLSREAEGTGVGLYLVKSFAEVMGGTIQLISEEGVGSTFTVLLPLIREQTEPNPGISKDTIEKVVLREMSDIIG